MLGYATKLTKFGLCAAVLASAPMLLPAQSALANNAGGYSVTTTTTTTETTETVEYSNVDAATPQAKSGNSRLLPYELGTEAESLAQYGPFKVLSGGVVEMNGEVDGFTPGEFRKLLAAHPGVKTVKFIDVPGTVDDEANLTLARMIRAKGMHTYVPSNGSVRSGGVELFAAGVVRTAEPGAEFVVHSWIDEDGFEANDFPMSDPVHQDYIRYYEDMGLDRNNARAFYALTNSVSHDDQRRVTLDELRKHKLID